MATPLALLGAKRLVDPGLRIDSIGELGSQGVLTFVVALLLVGIARLVDEATALRAEVELLTVHSTEAIESARRSNVAGPLFLSALVVFVASLTSWQSNGAVPTIVVLPFLALAAVPVMTFVWTYIRLLVGLDRLGRARLALQPFPQDRSLGLGPVGSVAFSSFLLLAGATIPTLIATTQNPTTFVIAFAVLTVNVPIFFRSMWHLHVQMSGAKAQYVRQARDMYADAYGPLRAHPTQSVLRMQAPALDAARALEERAERIQVWPINDGLIAIIGFVVAGVASGLLVRFIVTAAHL